TFAHLPVTAFLMLDGATDRPLDSQRIHQLRCWREKLKVLECQLPCIGLTGEAADRQRQLLTASLGFVNDVVSKGRCSHEELLLFARTQTPLIEQNLAAAAAGQIDGLHAQMRSWRSELSKEEWDTLRVGILGAVLAREGNLAAQYF